MNFFGGVTPWDLPFTKTSPHGSTLRNTVAGIDLPPSFMFSPPTRVSPFTPSPGLGALVASFGSKGGAGAGTCEGEGEGASTFDSGFVASPGRPSVGAALLG